MSHETEHKNQRKLELLAPAGDWDCVRAAIENGADAIYFGLDCGFNARHRAKNFGISDLPKLTKLLRRRGVRGYVTLNTLVFASEFADLISPIEAIARSGIDAVLVQDFGVAQLVKQICPELEIHGSTQMSLTSAETIEVASRLGLSRVVLARELSIAEIRSIAAETEMPLEVFIHGALCVAYSGQCLTSESLGGRSANRGHCAQACRLPYELICDGEDRDLNEVRYLLSPQDLAGYAAIPELMEAGVASIKIEGRLKTAEYVANITRHYRRAIDEASSRGTVSFSQEDQREMELSFSRGFAPGWLDGNDHKRLVSGIHSAKRGIELGTILEADAPSIKVLLQAPVALGDGLAIHSSGGQPIQGGRIYSLVDHDGLEQKELPAGQPAWIGFGRDEIDWNGVHTSATVFKNDDPKLNRRLRQSFASEDPQFRSPIDLQTVAKTGSPLQLTGRLDNGLQVTVAGEGPLQSARKHPATERMMREKLERLGGTPFELRNFEATISDGPMVPLAMLNQLRRELVETLLMRLDSPPHRRIDVDAGRRFLEPTTSAGQGASSDPASDGPASGDSAFGDTRLTLLCRSLEQLSAVCESNPKLAMVYVDFHDIRQYREAVRIARRHDVPIGIATVRMQKPGEMGLLRALEKQKPDWILARNLAAIDYFRKAKIPTIADFSLNVANHRSALWLQSIGVQRVTASYDLNRDQLTDLACGVITDRMEVVIHQHMPMFHMEHCVYCAVLSPGTNKTNCGRPCDRHVVRLRDRVGAEHLLEADVACRNTLYNATPQSGAESVHDLVALGLRWFRIELLDQDAAAAVSTLSTYARLLAGEISGQQTWKTLQAANRVGVTRGTLESKRDPLAIL